ncbi:MAG TPA: ketoacyl-ACP synthase III [Labilithrix sp.]|nr:ketoacyl-ACP synthase III [Labilithrix sp.]
MKVTRFDGLGDVRIEATSHYLPPRKLTTDELFEGAGVDVASLLRLTGIHHRHFASADQATSDLAILAARPLLTRGPVDRLIVATVSPDYPSPATAPLVELGLGLGGPPAFDISATCSGYVFALDMAARAVLTGDERVMCVAAELRSRVLTDATPGVRCLFGDGASACLVAKGRGPLRLIATMLGTDGSGHSAVRVEAGGTRHPTSLETVEKKLHTLRVEDGPTVFFTAVDGFVEIASAFLKAVDVKPADIDLVVPHQANARILDRVARQLDIPLDRFVVIVGDTGNVGGASVGIALDHALTSRRIAPGQRVMLLTAGAGYTMAAALLEVCGEV